LSTRSRAWGSRASAGIDQVAHPRWRETLGVSAQREIEKAVRQALAEGKLKGNEKFPATGTITLGGIGLSHEIKGEIELE